MTRFSAEFLTFFFHEFFWRFFFVTNFFFDEFLRTFFDEFYLYYLGILNSMFRLELVDTLVTQEGVWPSFLVWSPPWLYASSVKNKQNILFRVTYKSLMFILHFLGWRNWKFQSVMKTLRLWTKEFCYLTWLKWLVTFPIDPQQKAGHFQWQWKVWLFLAWKTRKPLQLLSIVSRQSHNIEVAQGAIFMEQNIRFGLILGRLAILKKKLGANYEQLLRAFFLIWMWS